MPPKRAGRPSAVVATAAAKASDAPAAEHANTTASDHAAKRRGRPAKSPAEHATQPMDIDKDATAVAAKSRGRPAKSAAPSRTEKKPTAPTRKSSRPHPAKAPAVNSSSPAVARAKRTLKTSKNGEPNKVAGATRVQKQSKATTKTSGPSASKKTVGRPRKAAIAAKDTKASAKRGPGRPKKSDADSKTAAPSSKKRKSETETGALVAAKKPRTKAPGRPRGSVNQKKSAREQPVEKAAPKLNSPPNQRLDVYVMGDGANSELGLGTDPKAMHVLRPRLNPLLDANQVGVVSVATGGMHSVALSHDNKLYTWGVNDDGALGRKTANTGKMVKVDDAGNEAADSSDDDEETNGLNKDECTPTPIAQDSFPEGTKIASMAAGDSTCIVVTEEGQVYGWGDVRTNTGTIGFRPPSRDQEAGGKAPLPVLIPELKNIKQVAAGNNHFLALDKDGNVFVWGNGEQYELGRRPCQRTLASNLRPVRVPLLPKKKIRYVACGAYHSFAIEQNGTVWAWGLNADAQCGDGSSLNTQQQDGKELTKEDTCIVKPTKMPSLSKYNFKMIEAGNHHSVGIAGNGDAVAWGKAVNGQLGIEISDVSEDAKVYKGSEVEIIKEPVVVEAVGKVKHVLAESDCTIWITEEGQAYSHGDNQSYQCGQGREDEITEATLIDNTAVRGKKLNWAGGGGQYSILTGVHQPTASVPPAAQPAQPAPAAQAPQVNGEVAAAAASHPEPAKSSPTLVPA